MTLARPEDAAYFAQLGCYLQNLLYDEINAKSLDRKNNVSDVYGNARIEYAENHLSANNDPREGVYMDGIFSDSFGKEFLRKENPLFVIHAGDRESNIPITNEAIVGLRALNYLRDYFPTFQYIYAAFRAPALNTKSGAAFSDTDFFTTYTLVETLTDHLPLNKWIDENSENENLEDLLFQVLFQVFSALSDAYDSYGFSHNNLKMSNIFVRTFDTEQTINYKDSTIETKHVAKITNFIYSRIRSRTDTNHDVIPPTGMIDPEHGYSPKHTSNVIDIFNLLTEIATYRKSIEVERKFLIVPGEIKMVTQRAEVEILLLIQGYIDQYMKLIFSNGQANEDGLFRQIIDNLPGMLKYNSVTHRSSGQTNMGQRWGEKVKCPANLFQDQNGPRDDSCIDIGIPLRDDKTQEPYPHMATGYANTLTEVKNLIDRRNALKKAEADKKRDVVQWAKGLFSSSGEEREIIDAQILEARYGPVLASKGYSLYKAGTIAEIMQETYNSKFDKVAYAAARRGMVFMGSAVIILALLYLTYASVWGSLSVVESGKYLVFSVSSAFAESIASAFMSISSIASSLGSGAYELMMAAFEPVKSAVNARLVSTFNMDMSGLASGVSGSLSQFGGMISGSYAAQMAGSLGAGTYGLVSGAAKYAFLDWAPFLVNTLYSAINWLLDVLPSPAKGALAVGALFPIYKRYGSRVLPRKMTYAHVKNNIRDTTNKILDEIINIEEPTDHFAQYRTNRVYGQHQAQYVMPTNSPWGNSDSLI
jgi:hypothetical protein